MIGVVIDTNVVVSALLNAEGSEATVVDLALLGEVHLFASEAILKEYELTLGRPKFGSISADRVKQSLAALRQVATVVTPGERLTVSVDESDNRFLECAELAGAEFIVTGNKRHFPEQWKGTRVVNARELLNFLGADEQKAGQSS